MKQKYSILKDENEKKLIIKELGELEKDEFSLICEVAFEYKVVKAAIEEGKTSLVNVIRSPNLFPPAFYMERIAEEIIRLFSEKETFSTEIVIDDSESLLKKSSIIEEENRQEDEEPVDMDVSPDDIDSLLDVDDVDDVDDSEYLGNNISPDIIE